MYTKTTKYSFISLLSIVMVFCFCSCQTVKKMEIKVFETSKKGNNLKEINQFDEAQNKIEISINPNEKFQTITGFGGSFTEASASLLNRLSKANRKKILDAYFSEDGANYSLTRTTIASCDFSLSNYTYAAVPNDLALENGIPKYPEAWERAKTYHQRNMIDNPERYNEKYKFILSTTELKSYYEMFEKYNKHFREILDVEYTQLPNNFLPNVRKSMSERITEQGVNGLIAGTKDFFSDFSIREEDRSADTTYNSNEQIPIFYLNRFRSSDGSLIIGEKSYQFGRSLAVFAKMAYNYEASIKREAEIKALEQFLTVHGEQISQSRGKNLLDALGNPITEKLQQNELPLLS